MWSFSTFAGRPSVNLHDFSVSPEAQSLGVGTVLLEALETRAHARGCAKMAFKVNASNFGAQSLYRRAGFEGWKQPTYFVSKALGA